LKFLKKLEVKIFVKGIKTFPFSLKKRGGGGGGEEGRGCKTAH